MSAHVCVRTHMQGFACLLQPNSELQSDNRELWVISHHASSGTAGGQEPHHISSHSDLGGKLPSLNSDVQERERGSQKNESVWYTMGKQNGRRAGTSYERNLMEQNEVLLQSPKCGKTLMQYWSRKSPLCMVVKGQIYNTIPLWWKQKRTLVFFSFFSPSVLFPLSLASGCDCTGLNSGSVLIWAALWGLM